MKKRNLSLKVFNSFEDEAKHEYQRRSAQTPAERMKEFALLQERYWGKQWTESKIQKQISFEELTW